jgi:hypothetical protein
MDLANVNPDSANDLLGVAIAESALAGFDVRPTP